QPQPLPNMPLPQLKFVRRAWLLAAAICLPLPLCAQEIDTGNNAWLMTSSALVLFMTLPGLALFYGGLVQRKNVLSVLAQCLGIAGMVTLLWWAVGYSLAFGTSFDSSILGGTEHLFLRGVGAEPSDY